MKNERGHGSHWSIFGNPDEFLPELLPQLFKISKASDHGKMNIAVEGTPKQPRDLLGLRYDEGILSITTIFVPCPELNKNFFLSTYPSCYNGTLFTKAKVNKVIKWSSGYEAAVEVSLETGHVMTFFAVDYYAHSDMYKKGKEVDIRLSAFAYTAEILKEEELNFEFTGQQAVDFLAKSGQEPEYDEEGNIVPVRFCMDDLVALLPREGAYADDADFQSPVLNVYGKKFLGQSFYSIEIMIGRDPDISVPLYAAKELFEKKPNKKDAIRGVLWLQGCLSESHQG